MKNRSVDTLQKNPQTNHEWIHLDSLVLPCWMSVMSKVTQAFDMTLHFPCILCVLLGCFFCYFRAGLKLSNKLAQSTQSTWKHKTFFFLKLWKTESPNRHSALGWQWNQLLHLWARQVFKSSTLPALSSRVIASMTPWGRRVALRQPCGMCIGRCVRVSVNVRFSSLLTLELR